MKGRILKRLKSIPNVGYLKQGQTLHHGFSDPSPPPDSGRILREMPIFLERSHLDNFSELTGGINGQEDVDESREPIDDKENIRPAGAPGISLSTPKKRSSHNSSPAEFSKLERPPFRRPDLNSETLFDPNLLAEFHQAVMDHMRRYQEARSTSRSIREDIEAGAAAEEEEFHRDDCPPMKVPRTEEEEEPLTDFEERCPPAGSTSAILYTTTLRGIRKTFEDCNSVRFLLESLKVVYYERDVSMHMDFREELWRVLGGRAIPPRLFIRGRYIGGADEVLGLHEQGKLLPMVQGLLQEQPGVVCEECGGMRFLVCLECNGSRKIYGDEIVQCSQCNENGLILCPLCC